MSLAIFFILDWGRALFLLFSFVAICFVAICLLIGRLTVFVTNRIPVGRWHVLRHRWLAPAFGARARGRGHPGQALLRHRQEGGVLSGWSLDTLSNVLSGLLIP